MRASLFTLAGILPFVQSQQLLYPNASYSDALSLVSNQTSLTALWAALQQYIDIASPFAHYSNVTMLAPDNNAVARFQTSSSEFAQPNNRTSLEAVLKYHILQGQFLNNSKLSFGQSFLAPSGYTNVTGGQNVGIDTRGGNMTFISGQGQKAMSVSETLYWEGGVVHIVDSVLTVPMDISSTTTFLNLTATSGAFNLTGITTSLTSTWDVTIFAPANSGFAAIASEAANMSVDQVMRLMKYHMLVGKVVYSNQFSNTKYTTILGEGVNMVTNLDGSVFVNNARVIQSDILLANGVLHIIDNVLNPDNTTTVPTPTASGVVAFDGARANGTTPFTNVPLPNSTSPGPALNSTAPTSSPSPSPNAGGKSSAMSGGVYAAIALGAIIAIASLIAGIYVCLRMRGYHVKVSRKSILISSPQLIQDFQYELPQNGGKTEKVELPACVPSAYVKPKRPDFGTSDTSTTQSDTAALLEKPPVPPAKDDVRLKQQPSISPASQRDHVFELSADQDVRARIEKLLRPKDR